MASLVSSIKPSPKFGSPKVWFTQIWFEGWEGSSHRGQLELRQRRHEQSQRGKVDVGHRDARHFSVDGTSGFTIQLPCEFHRCSWFSYLCFLERFPFHNQPTETCPRFHLISRWASLGFREGKPEADVLHGHASGGAGTIWSPGTGQGNDDADVMPYPPRLTFVNAVPTLGL